MNPAVAASTVLPEAGMASCCAAVLAGYPMHVFAVELVAAGCASGNSYTGRIVACDAVTPFTSHDTP